MTPLKTVYDSAWAHTQTSFHHCHPAPEKIFAKINAMSMTEARILEGKISTCILNTQPLISHDPMNTQALLLRASLASELKECNKLHSTVTKILQKKFNAWLGQLPALPVNKVEKKFNHDHFGELLPGDITYEDLAVMSMAELLEYIKNLEFVFSYLQHASGAEGVRDRVGVMQTDAEKIYDVRFLEMQQRSASSGNLGEIRLVKVSHEVIIKELEERSQSAV